MGLGEAAEPVGVGADGGVGGGVELPWRPWSSRPKRRPGDAPVEGSWRRFGCGRALARGVRSRRRLEAVQRGVGGMGAVIRWLRRWCMYNRRLLRIQCGRGRVQKFDRRVRLHNGWERAEWSAGWVAAAENVELATNRKSARARRGALLEQMAWLGVVAGSLLAVGVAVRAQDDASKQQETLLTHESGFLGDMYPNSAGSEDVGSGGVLEESGYFEDVEHVHSRSGACVSAARGAGAGDQDPEQLAKLAQDFTKAVKTQLGEGHYKLVTKPGPGVMVLRLAITNVEPNDAKENVVAQGAADAALHAAAPGASLLVPRFRVGSVAIEGEMVDSQTGEVEVAFMSSRSGRRYFSGLKQYEKWGDIDAAFADWAKGFRERLDAAHKA